MNTCEELSFATTQIIVLRKDRSMLRGTGFFVNVQAGGVTELILVTNRHVVEDSLKTSMIVSLRNENFVSIGKTQTIDILGAKWIAHPDPNIDLCCYRATEFRTIVEKKDGVEWFITPFERNQIARREDLMEYAPTDEVYMVGYPDGLRDVKNNQPFFRRGIMAGIPYLDHNGDEVFVVDMPVYPGSSGSPVFGIRHGITAKDRRVVFMPQHDGHVKLLGVMSKTYLHAANGEIAISTVGSMLIPNNLGIAIKAYKIFDFEAVLV